MTRLLIKLIGFIVLLIGVYFLGKNIIFATHIYPYYWRNLPAMGSVLAIMSGAICLIFLEEKLETWSDFVGNRYSASFLERWRYLKTNSLWNFFIGFVALAGGYKLLNEGRIRF
jgi:cytochrome c biogenesis protein CcdA